MDKYLENLDKMVISTLETIEQRIGTTNYNKIEDSIKVLMRESRFAGEHVVLARIRANKKIDMISED